MLTLGVGHAQILQFSGAPASGLTTWAPINVGPGGQLTGVDVANDSSLVVRADVYNGYIWDAVKSSWYPVISSLSMPPADLTYSGSPGVYEIVFAPSNSNRVYMMFFGKVFRSDNKGVTWTRTAFTPLVSPPNPNQPWKITGPHIAVDPANQDVVYVGTPDDGLFVSTNAGSSWATVAAVAHASNTASVNNNGQNHPGIAIVFDRSSSVVGGKTQRVLVFSYGTGLYESTNGGSTWTLTTSTPTAYNRLAVGPTGAVFITTDEQIGNNAVWSYASATWTNLNPSGAVQWDDIVPDPLDSTRLVAIAAGGVPNVGSLSAGTWTWNGVQRGTTQPANGCYSGAAPHRIATDVPWLAWTNECFMPGAWRFDPITANKLYFGEGIGFWTTNIVGKTPNINVSIDLTSQSAGIQELVGQWITSSPAYPFPILLAGDRPIWNISSFTTAPSTHNPSRSPQISSGWRADWASSAPGTICALVAWFTVDGSGCSTDGGATWTKFATSPFKPVAVTNASTAAGSNVLHFANGAIPSTVALGETVDDLGFVLTTNASSAGGTAVLHFASVPAGVVAGMNITVLSDDPATRASTSGIPVGTATVASVTGGDVTISMAGNILTAGIPLGSKISFTQAAGDPLVNSCCYVKAITSTSITISANAGAGGVLSGETIVFNAGFGGDMAVSTPSNIVWVPSNNQSLPWYTTDGGATWNNVDIGGVGAGVPRTCTGTTTAGSNIITNLSCDATQYLWNSVGYFFVDQSSGIARTTVTSIDSATQIHVNGNCVSPCGAGTVLQFETGWSFAYYETIHAAAADRVNANTFYLANYITGFYVSQDGGATWTLTCKKGTACGNSLASYGGTGGVVRTAIGAGNTSLVFISGGDPVDRNSPIAFSTNCPSPCNTFTNIGGGLDRVSSFDLGKNKPGRSYPTIFVVGNVGGVYGVWRADDWDPSTNNPTWINIGTYPNNSIDGAVMIEADKSIYGQAYIAFGGSGFAYGKLNYLLKRDIDPGANDNTPVGLRLAA